MSTTTTKCLLIPFFQLNIPGRRLAHFHLRVQQLGEGQSGGGGHDAGAQQMRRGDAKTDVGGHHRAGNGCKATSKDSVKLRFGHDRKERLHKEGTFSLGD